MERIGAPEPPSPQWGGDGSVSIDGDSEDDCDSGASDGGGGFDQVVELASGSESTNAASGSDGDESISDADGSDGAAEAPAHPLLFPGCHVLLKNTKRCCTHPKIAYRCT